MFDIDRNVPAPTDITVRNKYPLAKLFVGESFLVPGGAEVRDGIKAAVFRAKRRLPGKVFTVRKVEGGYRCWRIA